MSSSSISSQSSASSESSSSSCGLADIHWQYLTLNVSSGWVINSAGFALRYAPDIYLSDNVNLTVQCVDDNLAPVDVSGYSYLLGVDTSYVHDHTDAIRSTTVCSRRASAGLLSFTLNMDDYGTALKALLGTKATVGATCCIWAYNPGDATDTHLLAQFAVRICSSVGIIANEIFSSSSSQSTLSSQSSQSSESSESSSVSSVSSQSSQSSLSSDSSLSSISSQSSQSSLSSQSSVSSVSSFSSLSSQSSQSATGIGAMVIGSTFIVG